MNFTKAFSLFSILFALALTSANNGLVNGAGNVGNGTTFSSPQVGFADNGDRTSHYPPYYHPTE